MQIIGNHSLPGSVGTPPLPPVPPGPQPGPGGPVVTPPNANGAPIGIVFASKDFRETEFTVSFSFDFVVVTPAAITAAEAASAAQIDTIEVVLVSTDVTAKQLEHPIAESDIVYKNVVAGAARSWNIRGAGAMRVSDHYFDANAHRKWTLALRVRGQRPAAGAGAGAGEGSAVIQIIVISMPVMGNAPPFLDLLNQI